MNRRRYPLGAALAALATLMIYAFASPAGAAIVNSLRGFKENEVGWSGSISGSYGASGGNTVESTLAGAAQVQHKGVTDTWRLIGSAKRTTSRGEETAKAILGHVRYIHDLSPRWAALAFLQAQQNPFQRLDARYLAGLGARWDAFEDGAHRWSLGATHMWEEERIADEDDPRRTGRLSAFTSYEAEVRDGVTLDAVVFYQPRWSDFGDWRLFGQIQLEVELYKSLSLFTGYQIEHNERPPAGVEMTDWETITGFKAEF